MEEISKDFIDQAVEKTYKKLLYRATVERAKINKKKAKRKMERQNRKKGRK